MKLDQSKKYELGGEPYSCEYSIYQSDFMWGNGTVSLHNRTFQHFADRGLVKEVREPMRYEGVKKC